MKNCILFILTLFITNALFAHTGSILGHVTDSKNKSPLEFASIAIPSLNTVTSTNMSGTFIFSDIEEGTYILEISCIGHAKKTIQVAVSDEADELINIALDPIATLLKEVIK